MRLVDVDAAERLMSDTVQGDIRGYPYEDETWNTAFMWLDSQPSVGWIPVSERLPDYDQVVLVTGSLGVIFTAYYSYPFGEPDGHWVDGGGYKMKNPPVAWMPLPEPYREEAG